MNLENNNNSEFIDFRETIQNEPKGWDLATVKSIEDVSSYKNIPHQMKVIFYTNEGEKVIWNCDESDIKFEPGNTVVLRYWELENGNSSAKSIHSVITSHAPWDRLYGPNSFNRMKDVLQERRDKKKVSTTVEEIVLSSYQAVV